MSRSFTSRPTVTNSRGRGRGTQSRTPQPVNAGRVGTMNTRQPAVRPQQPQGMGARPRPGTLDPGYQGAEGGMEDPGRQQSQEIGQRMSYQGGYTLITPNQRKREQISQVAQRETMAYQAHKQQNTPKQLNYVGTAGGGQVTQATARRELIQSSQTKTGKLLQKEERKSYFKQKEEEEIEKKKQEQRRKSELNERRQREQEQADAHKWDEQRRRQNDAFLNRLERQNQAHHQSQSSSAQVSSQSPPQPAQPVPNLSSGRGGNSTSTVRGGYSTSTVRGDYSTSTVREGNSLSTGRGGNSTSTVRGGYSTSPGRGGNSKSTVAMATENRSEEFEDTSNEFEIQRVSALSAIYPQYSRQELVEILKSVDYSLDTAISILSD